MMARVKSQTTIDNKNIYRKINFFVKIYVTVGTIVGDVENYVSVVLSWIRLGVTFEDLFLLH